MARFQNAWQAVQRMPWARMAAPLGNALFQIGRIGAGIFAILTLLAILGGTENAQVIAAFFALAAMASWICGRLLRYIFAGASGKEA